MSIWKCSSCFKVLILNKITIRLDISELISDESGTDEVRGPVKSQNGLSFDITLTVDFQLLFRDLKNFRMFKFSRATEKY